MNKKSPKKSQQIFVTKASGEKELFRPEKIIQSLRRAGISEEVQQDILEEVERRLYDSIPTKELYRIVSRLLKQYQPSRGFSRYGLKRAIMELGPTGFPFERFVGEILKQEGFEVQVGKIVQGECVQHEIDVIAQKANKHFMVECKYHNRPGIKTDAKVALYVYGRFLDVERAFHQAWIITNTKLTSEAIKFSRCVGIRAIGWRYPRDGGLERIIEKSGLHPLTILSSLSRSQKKTLLHQRIVLCRELLTKENILKTAGLNRKKIEEVKEESRAVCRI